VIWRSCEESQDIYWKPHERIHMPSTGKFIDRYTAGFDAYKALLYAVSWEELELQSGMLREQIRTLGEVYRKSRSAIISWCLGVTQQEHGVDTVREIVNVLLLRGNIGREGAGPCPIRGHSNVRH
jgi:anaerobic selenocysteine-containing dehydrogenase